MNSIKFFLLIAVTAIRFAAGAAPLTRNIIPNISDPALIPEYRSKLKFIAVSDKNLYPLFLPEACVKAANIHNREPLELKDKTTIAEAISALKKSNLNMLRLEKLQAMSVKYIIDLGFPLLVYGTTVHDINGNTKASPRYFDVLYGYVIKKYPYGRRKKEDDAGLFFSCLQGTEIVYRSRHKIDERSGWFSDNPVDYVVSYYKDKDLTRNSSRIEPVYTENRVVRQRFLPEEIFIIVSDKTNPDDITKNILKMMDKDKLDFSYYEPDIKILKDLK
ncbi:MAG: hypothetical protein ACLFQK_05805 [Fibrobacterota bacterium]